MNRLRTRPLILPATATPDAARLVTTRALRGLADGAVSVVLASYLGRLGFSPLEVGALVTATLLGSAVLTLALGLLAHRMERRRILLGACGLMVATGLAFASITAFWPLLVVAFVGTINPSSGDVTLFLPTEQAVLAETSEARDRVALFAWYNVAGTLAGALGALAAGLPDIASRKFGLPIAEAERAVFYAYSAVGLVSAAVYAGLSRTVEQDATAPGRPLSRSRRVVLELSALFSLDSFGGGFVVQSLLALYLFRRFALSLETAAAFFFAAGTLAAFSQIMSARLAARIGHIRTMVFTHLPSNLFLILAGLMPTAPLAILFLLLRMALSQMDVPARQAFVMAVVPREERAAASSVTNVPRSLAAALSPFVAGYLLDQTSFGWPLIVGGILKAIYDLALFARFSQVRPQEGA
ncbi:MAG: MFS transporter [Deltaproteobacteria bacterium]|nr:MAG: MFS transporter [Deltaproteobacteria bacterium]TMB34372.1 MAG: MFS transporter [Deltaproteobacteria bacterium]